MEYIDSLDSSVIEFEPTSKTPLEKCSLDPLSYFA
jgi:hypothetical protein